MRIFFQEHKNEYPEYAFGYRVYAEREPEDDLNSIYAQGFLPYSGNPEESRDIFYMARSARVVLHSLRFRKKRRYEQRNGDSLGISRESLSVDELWQRFSKNEFCQLIELWMSQRFGEPYLSRNRIHYIFKKDFLNRVFIYTLHNQPCAVILACDFFPSLHYWYAFYDPNRFPGVSLGAWCMGDVMTASRQSNYQSIYLGTLYGQSSYYKLKGIEGSQFWNGSEWSTNMKDLKSRLAADEA